MGNVEIPLVVTRACVADITYIPTWPGFLFLAVVVDVQSRQVVGWPIANHLRMQVVTAALDMVVAQRQPVGVIRHPDHRCQYTSVAFGHQLRQASVLPSRGTAGDAFNNMFEALFASLERDLHNRHVLCTHAGVRMAVFRYIEGWYKPYRRRFALDHQSPGNYEKKRPARPEPAIRDGSTAASGHRP